MDIELMQREKQRVVERFGEWTAHNIQLEGDLYTIGKRIVGDEIWLRRVVQIAFDTVRKPFNNLRILDLACCEGLYAIEFALHGAQVVAIEGREVNIEKARFAKKVLSLDNIEFVQDDVRNLSKERYGSFDVVLCLGILYHLDAPDVFSFLETINQVCREVTVVDTHVSLRPIKSYVYKGKEYWGRKFVEHRAKSTPEEKAKALWASLDNPTSFWLTRPSLYNLLSHVGFTSAYECYIPATLKQPADRITILAVKGQRPELICCPLINSEPANDLLEKFSIIYADKLFGGLNEVRNFIPRPVKKFLKKLLR